MSFPKTNIIVDETDQDLNKGIDAIANIRRVRLASWAHEFKNFEFRTQPQGEVNNGPE